jgi:hypothetical protein
VDFFEWLQSIGPGLGVSVVFIAAWWFERRANIELRREYIRDLRRWAGIYREPEQNGDEIPF